MRAVLLALALVVGIGATDAFAKDTVVVKLRDGDAPKTKAKAKPAAKKRTPARAKRKPVRKSVAKSKPKPKQQPAPANDIRPMP